MATTNRLGALIAVGLSAVSASAFADEVPVAPLSIDLGDGFLSRPTSTGDDLLAPRGLSGSSSSAMLGLAPSRSFAFDLDWGSGLRSELRSDFVDAPAGDHGPGATQLSLLGNVIYDFAIPETGIGAHLGAGAGLDSTRLGFGPAGDLLAYQLLAGTDYAVSPQLRLGAEYRYLGTLDFTEGPAGGLPRYNPAGHSLLFTLRYDWGAAGPIAPGIGTAMPALAEPLENPPAPKAPLLGEGRRSFEIAFDLNRSDVAGPASATLRQIAETVRNGETIHITVTAPSDTVGTVADKHILSLRRADAIRDGLVADGVPDSEIAVRHSQVAGVAETPLLVEIDLE